MKSLRKSIKEAQEENGSITMRFLKYEDLEAAFYTGSFWLVSSLHPEIKKQIKKALNDLRENPYAENNLEELSGFKTQRLKQYRIYGVNENQKSIQVYYVGRRRDAINNSDN